MADRELIMLVEGYPSLWNKSAKFYRDIDKTTNACREIADELNTTGNFIDLFLLFIMWHLTISSDIK